MNVPIEEGIGLLVGFDQLLQVTDAATFHSKGDHGLTRGSTIHLLRHFRVQQGSGRHTTKMQAPRSMQWRYAPMQEQADITRKEKFQEMQDYINGRNEAALPRKHKAQHPEDN